VLLGGTMLARRLRMTCNQMERHDEQDLQLMKVFHSVYQPC